MSIVHDRDDILARILAERACERLMLEYARAVDSGRASAVADLFTQDGVWLGADGRGMQGRAEIQATFAQREAMTRRRSRHVITNVLVEVDGPTEAHGIAYLVNYRHDSRGEPNGGPAPADHPKFVGDYHLSFRLEDSRWRIAALRFDLAFLRTSGTGTAPPVRP